jgi:tetratricopeptide (TPR) repeat protein
VLALVLGLASCADCSSHDSDEPGLLRQGDPLSSVAEWRKVYDEVPAAETALARAREVFEKVRAASGQDADLVVLEMGRGPVALALSDPAVVLSRAGLDFCYEGVSPGVGDTRLAFVLGHELAHLKNGDFWHASAFATARELEGADEVNRALRALLAEDSKDRKKAELRADDEGALALVMAEYDPRALFDRDVTFFEEWVQAVPGLPAYQDAEHPTPAERARLLQARLAGVVGKVALFDQGVAAFREADELASTASEAGPPPELAAKYEEAVKDFDAFRRVFPGREVLSNLALAHLRLAAGRLAACDGSLVRRYYLPTALDPVTLAARARLRGERDYSSPCFENEAYRRHMTEAIRLLEDAAARDSEYRPARLNQVAAYVLDEREASAADAARQARERWPDDPKVAAAWTGAFLAYLDRGSTYFDPEKLFEEIRSLHRRFPDEPGISFNLASALSLDGRLEEARPVWREFLRVEPDGAWAEIAKEWLGE